MIFFCWLIGFPIGLFIGFFLAYLFFELIPTWICNWIRKLKSRKYPVDTATISTITAEEFNFINGKQTEDAE